ncbi:hypothetical protein, partial [Paenibacillus sp. S150]|uniref:hypothetical protein n=1 Tax=Paenibacillus sp. S150 TaxID=2749826 RepID=UPI001C575463
ALCPLILALFGFGHLANLLDLRYAYDLMLCRGFIGGLGLTLTIITPLIVTAARLPTGGSRLPFFLQKSMPTLGFKLLWKNPKQKILMKIYAH